ncbi:E3 ubiquitin-protein ligase ATL42-like [Cornus florida]|uniref:E3 ubiquitin-protein ligase ATL42-like n=1 Tax=Cornus florida TaxID=4283 RepID=UPI0028A27ACA|nr:E3 ubiquitin-protein ligase ATL42-like [Cornus florida]
MNQLVVFILLVFFFFFHVKAQSPSSAQDMLSQHPTSFQHANITFVIGVLCVMVSLIFIILVFAKFYLLSSSVDNNQQTQDGVLTQSRPRFSGIDKTVVESLPFFRFSSLDGSREGLECPVCLSKFQDTEILRSLPKCKHAFHINCVDPWLEKHSSCPLCRTKVSADDLTYSNSSNYLWNQSERRQDSNLELVVQREEDHHGSSRFCSGSSFRKSGKGKKEEELPIQENCDSHENEKGLHKLKNRWSSVSSSDLMLLNSEMLNAMSSYRFSSLDTNNDQFVTGSRVAEREIMLNPKAERSMSEIAVHPRFIELNMRSSIRDSTHPENNVEEDRLKRLWLTIARRTVQWFANREERTQQYSHNTRESLNV